MSAPYTQSLTNGSCEVADIFRLYALDYLKHHRVPTHTHHLIFDIRYCRTALMGGHQRECDQCHYQQNAYNSCQNRHCPKCQALKKARWLSSRKAELLPIGYFHTVFTLPHELNPLIFRNKRVLLNILFCSVKETLATFARDPRWRLNGQLGYTAILHTWNQMLNAHFHLHCIIPAGVLSFDKDRWIHTRKRKCRKTGINKDYLFSVEALSRVFKGKFLDQLRQAFKSNQLVFPRDIQHLSTLRDFDIFCLDLSQKDWVVYSKAPFKGPEYVFEYLGRYVHRVAISNDRIKSINNGTVTFSYKDRNEDYKTKETTLPADRFIGRFLLHELPPGFMKIRHYGFLASRNKQANLAIIRKCLKVATPLQRVNKSALELMLELTGKDLSRCPRCEKGCMKSIGIIQKPSRYQLMKTSTLTVGKANIESTLQQLSKPFW